MKRLSKTKQATLVEQLDRCLDDRETTLYYIDEINKLLDEIFDFAEVNGYEDTKLWKDLQELGLKLVEMQMYNKGWF